uniref:Uncharacterized protein n=1 Tax=viral metagenome TaxID=1070528 RepID=A0A6C0HKV1_9ZZZZ
MKYSFIDDKLIIRQHFCKDAVLKLQFRHITLPSDYNEPLDWIPEGVESINFQSFTQEIIKFNCPINKLSSTIKSIKLYGNYDQPLDNLPPNLLSLTISTLKYSYSLDNLPFPLKELFIYTCKEYCGYLDSLPPNLEILDIKTNYNKPLDNLPKLLKKLYICSSIFNQPLNNLPGVENIDIINTRQTLRKKNLLENRKNEKVIYSGLEMLSMFTIKFNQPLDNLPPTLKYLYINGNIFNHPVNNLPFNLLTLYIYSNIFNQSIDNLPCRLKYFQISSETFNHSINYLSNSINELYLTLLAFNQSISKLPKCLHNLHINCPHIDNINILKLPANLRFIKIYNNKKLQDKLTHRLDASNNHLLIIN